MSNVATLYEVRQAHAVFAAMWKYAKDAVSAGQKLQIELRDEDQSRDQQKMYHAMIGEIAEQASHLGSKWATEDWKRLLIDQFARETGRTHGKVIPNLDHSGVVEVGVLSRKFSKKTAAEFITYLEAWGATNGVRFRSPEYAE